MERKLIYICGPDGVGKSTQANLIIKNLKDKGQKFEYRWLRFHHLFSLPLLVIARLMGLSEIQILRTGEKIGYHYFNKSKIISFLYPVLLFFDTLLFAIIKLYIPMKLLKKNIVCDRFVYDTVIDIMISTRKYEFYNSKLGEIYFKLIPKNTIILMLMTNIHTLETRRTDLSEDNNLSIKINLYNKFADKYGIKRIDANGEIKDINREIINNM